jgi:adenylate cyclase
VAIDWEAEGLLAGLEDQDVRSARRDLLDRLHADGFTLDELRRACEEGRLALLPAERALEPEGARFSAEDVAREAGLERELLDAIWRALGLPLVDPDEPAYSEADVDAARTVAFFRAAGVPDEGLIEVTRVIGRGMADLVATLDVTIAPRISGDAGTELDVAVAWSTALRELAPKLDPLLLHVLSLHRRDRIRRAVVDATELGPGRLAGARPVSIAFADLVGFTRLGEEVPPEELGAVALRLDALAAEAARPPVRLVKTIGDAAMLASPDADALLGSTLDLLDAADAEGADFPQLRAGVASGEAVPRGADWYGRPVNLASRLTAFARPASLVADDALRAATSGDYAWRRIGRRRFKGIRGEVEVFRVRRADGERGDEG